MNLPIAIPDCFCLLVSTRDAGTCAIRSLHMIKVLTIKVAESKMSKIQIASSPERILGLVASQSCPKESEFKAEAMAIRVAQISRVVPPLRLKLGMIEVITGKPVVVSGKSHPVLRGCETGDQQNQQRQGSTPHG